MQTHGQYRVGVSFNPSADPLVDAIKQKAAELIDLVQSIPTAFDNTKGLSTATLIERERLKLRSKDLFEDGAMLAVKAATKPNRE